MKTPKKKSGEFCFDGIKKENLFMHGEISKVWLTQPSISIQTSVLNSFCNMIRANSSGTF